MMERKTMAEKPEAELGMACPKAPGKFRHRQSES